MNVTEGQIIQFSEGAYSDYHISGTFKVLKPFNVKEESDEYLAVDLGTRQYERIDYDWLKSQGLSYFEAKDKNLEIPMKTVTLENEHETSSFLARLTEKGLIEDFEVREFHCGDYKFTGVS